MNFEAFGISTGTKNLEQKMAGLEGMCEKCHGKGSTRVGLFDKRMCGKCHGKGFMKSKSIEDKSQSSEGGAIH